MFYNLIKKTYELKWKWYYTRNVMNIAVNYAPGTNTCSRMYIYSSVKATKD